MRKLLLTSILIGAALQGAAADETGFKGPSISGYYYYTQPDSDLDEDLRDGTGYGLRFGYAFNHRFEWDVGALYATHDFRNKSIPYADADGFLTYANNAKVTYKAVTTDFNFHFHPWNNRTSLYVGGGVGYNNFKSEYPYFFGCGCTTTDQIKRFLWEVDLGARFAMGSRVSLIVDARQHFFKMPSRREEGKSELATERFLGVGLGLFLGRTGPCPDADGDGTCDNADNCDGTPAGARVDSKGCPTDEDGDGVWDGLDRCPGTPKGARVDAHGCEFDDDGDGVVNSQDRCPNTPRGATVDAHGCPSDGDGDGVWDGIDRCPNTPRGDKVDAYGCTIDADDDGDGIPNSRDKCPTSARGAKIGPDGCPVRYTESRPVPIVVLTSAELNFASGSAVISHASFQALDQAAVKILEYIKNNPDAAHLDVVGHCDSQGSYNLNSRLSRARANAVRAYLIRRGVPAENLQATGMGYSQPIDTNDTPEGRRNNRRVEVTPHLGATTGESRASPEAGVPPGPISSKPQ